MKRIDFKNLPDTTTPISADNLNKLQNNIEDAINAIYPVGAIYISVNNTNPGNFLIGTWEAFGAGRTLVGIDSDDTDFNTSEKVGGSKYMQRHSHHGLYYNQVNTQTPLSLNGGTHGYQINFTGSWSDTEGKGIDSDEIITNYEGTGDSGNLQPYITVYMWKRVQ